MADGPSTSSRTVTRGLCASAVDIYTGTRASLEIEARYAARGDTGVITRRLTLANTGTAPIRVRMDSLALELPPGEYDLSCLWGGWGRERQLATEPLGPGRRDFVSRRGRSTNGYASWFSLHNKTLGVQYAAELAYSGNWEMSFERYPGSAPLAADNLDVRMGMRFDSGGVLTLAPGRRFELPAVAMTASGGSFDDAANHLHRYQREFVMARNPANQPPLVQFNSWYPFQGKLTIADTKRLADAASGIGAEVFVLDAGWYNKKDWSRELGDYEADPVGFPGGLAELGAYVRSKGMKFGIWTEIENLGTGQVRLNYTINQVWDEIEWDRDMNRFYDFFTDLAIQHYQRVGRDAQKRIEAIEAFKSGGYARFQFTR